MLVLVLSFSGFSCLCSLLCSRILDSLYAVLLSKFSCQFNNGYRFFLAEQDEFLLSSSEDFDGVSFISLFVPACLPVRNPHHRMGNFLFILSVSVFLWEAFLIVLTFRHEIVPWVFLSVLIHCVSRKTILIIRWVTTGWFCMPIVFHIVDNGVLLFLA